MKKKVLRFRKINFWRVVLSVLLFLVIVYAIFNRSFLTIKLGGYSVNVEPPPPLPKPSVFVEGNGNAVAKGGATVRSEYNGPGSITSSGNPEVMANIHVKGNGNTVADGKNSKAEAIMESSK